MVLATPLMDAVGPCQPWVMIQLQLIRKNLLVSPRSRFVGGTRVMAAIALVKTANTVALMGQRCVIVVAPTWSLG